MPQKIAENPLYARLVATTQEIASVLDDINSGEPERLQRALQVLMCTNADNAGVTAHAEDAARRASEQPDSSSPLTFIRGEPVDKEPPDDY